MRISDIKEVSFQNVENETGILSIFETVPFELKRIFTITAKDKCTRGNHAHKECIQLIVCLNGSTVLVCDDGQEKKTFHLNEPYKGVLIPAGIWSHQDYESKGTVALVLCNQEYDENDYIRNYDDFLSFIKS